MTTHVAGMLLAAGDGSRLGQPKATVLLGGRTLAERGVALLRGGGAAPVLVVAGAVPVDLPGARTVYNPDWAAGMGSSLAAGLRALAAPDVPAPGEEAPGEDARDVDAVVIALADQPLIGPEAVRRLIAAHANGATVAVAAYEGKPRNPVLIARQHWPAVLELATGDTGARPFLRARPDLVTLVECGDTGSPDDIDTPDELARLRAARSAALHDGGQEGLAGRRGVRDTRPLSPARVSDAGTIASGSIGGNPFHHGVSGHGRPWKACRKRPASRPGTPSPAASPAMSPAGWPRLGQPEVRYRGQYCHVAVTLPGHREPTPILCLHWRLTRPVDHRHLRGQHRPVQRKRAPRLIRPGHRHPGTRNRRDARPLRRPASPELTARAHPGSGPSIPLVDSCR